MHVLRYYTFWQVLNVLHVLSSFVKFCQVLVRFIVSMAQNKMNLRKIDRSKQRNAYISVGYVPSMKLPKCDCLSLDELLAVEPVQPIQIKNFLIGKLQV